MISVVIPLYNKELSITATIQSVLNQSYPNFEVIVVDDGSQDSSVKKVLMIDDARLRLVRKSNGGVSSARNVGINVAKGNYVVFLDGDDVWNKDFLLELKCLVSTFPSAAIYGIGCCEVHNGEDFVDDESNPIRKTFDDTDWFSSGCYFTGSSTCIRKDVFLTVGLFDEHLTHGEDLDMWWRILAQYPAAFSSRKLAYYRQDAENRAMNRLIPLEHHIPYCIERYAAFRRDNRAFRLFFDTQMVYRLYPYLFNDEYRKVAFRLASQLDYSQLKWSMHFRIMHPYLYRIYEKLRGR